ncbi:DNA-binding protein [Candidatus Woesearchaeota archaeon]|nr:DNA-binding protein [Candidatus Woesearchaeota archaeon]
MSIAELQAGQGKVDIEAEVIEVEQPRTFEKFGKQGRVANATIKDDSGEIKLTLWNDQVDTIKPGTKIKITNGYVSEFKGEKQLTTGKFGKLEILS